VVSSQAMMATARLVDLSATAAALWLATTTLLALLVIYFVDIDQGGPPRQRSCGATSPPTPVPALCADDRQVQVQKNRYASTRVEGVKIV